MFHYGSPSSSSSALSGVTVKFEAGENIGVCGKTGSGKSTLANILFSLGPLTSGTVRIAGEDLASLGPADVRAGVAVVPQHPTILDGDIRDNLLGGNRGSPPDDAALLSMLKICKLDELVDKGLDGTMGSLSDGQKQLFCVARALVRKPKVLVLDEATADLDTVSANTLLAVVGAHFKETTVISIAHRLNFIRNSDKILVLNTGGTINAFDTPSNLINEGGRLLRQATQSGNEIDVTPRGNLGNVVVETVTIHPSHGV